MRLLIRCVDHDGLRIGISGSQRLHRADEQTHLAPPFSTIVEHLVRAVVAERITPAQCIAVHENDAAQHPPVVNSRLAMALGKVGRQARHLLVCQLVQVDYP